MQAKVTARERVLGLVLGLLLLACLGAALCARRLPAPLPPDAHEALFAAGRAQGLLAEIARAPHPVGSGEHDCVRARLLAELAALGLEPEQQSGLVEGVPLDNLLARIEGEEPGGIVLCLAHYDSVPSGPGAGDDGVGVVAWLEALRALRARGWVPRHDVLLLLSDGEELGLLGAQLFAREHPLAARVALVINLEAIGNGGPAVLFELGPRNGARVAAFARAVAAPTGTSLGDAVYRRMPNDTDLTVFLRRGIGGFNLALTSGSAAYHAPHDTPANLDPASLQHMGASALALLEHVSALALPVPGEGSVQPLDAPDMTFFDLLGRRLVVYPRWLDPLLALLAAAAFLRAHRRAGSTWSELRTELARHARGAAALAAGMALLWWSLDAGLALFTPRLGWVAGNTTSGAALFAACALACVAAELRRAGRGEDEMLRRALAALGAWSLAALVALVLLPGASFAFTLPALAAGGALLAWLDRARAPLRAAAVLAVTLALAALLGLPILQLLFQLFQRSNALALLLVGGVLASATTLFAPALRTLGRAWPRARGTLAVLAFVLLLASLWSARVLAWRQGALWP